MAPELGAVLEGDRRGAIAAHFHTFPTTPPRARQEAPQVRRAAMFTGVSAFQVALIHIIAGMMGAGVFKRYPRLRVSFGETGTGWLAYALHRRDFEFEDRFRDLMKLKPSKYWRRQCKATSSSTRSAPSSSTTERRQILRAGGLIDRPHPFPPCSPSNRR